MTWQAGVSGNPTGLARERDVVSVEHWLRKAERELNSKKLTATDRLQWQTKIIGLLLDRKDIPAKSAEKETKPKSKPLSLEDLENGRARAEATGTGSVGNRSIEVQAFADPAGD